MSKYVSLKQHLEHSARAENWTAPNPRAFEAIEGVEKGGEESCAPLDCDLRLTMRYSAKPGGGHLWEDFSGFGQSITLH